MKIFSKESVRPKRYEESCWPTPRQKLLLRAALLRGGAAVQAWQEWKADARIDRLDLGSRRLLPLLYKNLQRHGVEEHLIDDLKRVYRTTWSNNRVLFRKMAALLRSFDSAGIQTLLLKGAPLVLMYYRDYGLRPMADFDVLVRTKDALAAFELLKRSGWIPAATETLSERHISVKHGASFNNAAGQEFDLHWHLLPECCQPGADQDFWDDAVPIQIEQVPAYTLNPADHLLHVCAHGVKWNALPPLRWVADATAIVGGSEINWRRLTAQAQKRRLIWPIKEGLSYLRETLDAPIPDSVLMELRRMPTSRMEDIEYRYRTGNHREKLFGHLPALWINYLRAADDAGAKPRLTAFIKYLRIYWGADRPGQLVLRALAKSMRRIWNTLAARGRFPAEKR